VTLKDRLAIAVAIIASVGSIGGGVAGAVGTVVSSHATQPAECITLAQDVMDFGQKYPQVAALYAVPGPAVGLPRLATKAEIRDCGDPESYLERTVAQGP
jgi:hypothetical protein